MKRPVRPLIAMALLAAAALAADSSSAPRIVELIFGMLDPSGRGAPTTAPRSTEATRNDAERRPEDLLPAAPRGGSGGKMGAPASRSVRARAPVAAPDVLMTR